MQTPWIYPIAMFAQTSSVYLTVAVTVERWFAVCHPLMARTTNTTSKARKSILLVNLGSIVYNIPRFFEYRYNKVGLLFSGNNSREISLFFSFFRYSFALITKKWSFFVIMKEGNLKFESSREQIFPEN